MDITQQDMKDFFGMFPSITFAEGESLIIGADPREFAARMLTERGHDPMKTFMKNNWR
jgi:hypothetical protein